MQLQQFSALCVMNAAARLSWARGGTSLFQNWDQSILSNSRVNGASWEEATSVVRAGNQALQDVEGVNWTGTGTRNGSGMAKNPKLCVPKSTGNRSGILGRGILHNGIPDATVRRVRVGRDNPEIVKVTCADRGS